MRRALDLALILLLAPVVVPILFVGIIAVWLQDFKSPFYLAPRVGINGKIFTMVKIRSMVVNADKTGVTSTSNSDKRITIIGKIIRKFKLDELSQIWNVLLGEMSFVGPRPQVEWATKLYSEDEKILLTVPPGITDFASVVFADEGEILKSSRDPDKDYLELIAPWKNRLALFYIQNANVILNLKIIGITALAIVSRPTALGALQKLLKQLDAPEDLVNVSRRESPLKPILAY